jgi:hypothetical protein
LREALVPSGRQLFGHYLESIVVIAALLVAGAGLSGAMFVWGESGIASARPAPIFIVGTFIILIAWAIGVREVLPRLREVGLTGARQVRRTLKERYGISRLLRRRGLVTAVVITILLWAAMEASAVYNYQSLLNDGWTIKPGMYAALAFPGVGILAALMVLGRGQRTVRMDASGTVDE